MLKSLFNLGKILLFPVALATSVYLGILYGMCQMGKFGSEFVIKHFLGITKTKGYSKDYEDKLFSSWCEQLQNVSKLLFGKSIKEPFTGLAEKFGPKDFGQRFLNTNEGKNYRTNLLSSDLTGTDSETKIDKSSFTGGPSSSPVKASVEVLAPETRLPSP